MVGFTMAAEPFEPVFLLKQYNGKCQVKTPDSRSFVTAMQNRAYPYGTILKTGAETVVHLEFSKNNTCKVMANTTLELAEDSKNKKLKRLLLDVGKIEVTLDEELKETGNKIQVMTPTSICDAPGTRFTVAVQVEQDLKIAAFLVSKGIIKVWGEHFTVPELVKDGSVSIAASSDMSFIRLRNLKGKYKVEIRDENGEPRIVDTEPGATFKIHQRWSPDGKYLLVTTVLVSPDGELQESITHKVEADALTDVPEELLPEKPEVVVEEEETGETTTTTGQGVTVVTTTTSTTTTTTTTTVPSVTPVGRF